MKDFREQARVTAFLRNALAEAPQGVLKLEAMARREALLGEHQRITHARPFKRAKHSLRIRSVRAGFGTNGAWRWELPCDRDGARQPVRAERCRPVDWVEGVERYPKNLTTGTGGRCRMHGGISTERLAPPDWVPSDCLGGQH